MKRTAEEWREALKGVHELEHDRGMCSCDTPPEPEPVTADEEAQHWAEMGRRELAEMREAGLPLNLDHVEEVDLVALGRSVQPARLDRLLDQIVEERERQRPDPSSWTGTSGTRYSPTAAPEPSNPEGPSSEPSESEDATGQGRAGSASRSTRRRLDRNRKKTTMEKILDETMDDEQFPDG